jgi:hypothetical protein
MKNISDKSHARQLLEIRDRGGYELIPFLRANAPSYLWFYMYFTFGLIFLSPTESWAAFWFVTFVFLGIVLRDLIRFTYMRKSWSFQLKVINWDEVKKISEDEPSA